MKNNKKSSDNNTDKNSIATAINNDSTTSPTEFLNNLQEEADKDTKVRKPGSQSNSSHQHNNGRGGGK